MAATTRGMPPAVQASYPLTSFITCNIGFDITAYIRHSPGSTILDPIDTSETTDPDRYAAEHFTKLTFRTIAICIALSRYSFIHLARSRTHLFPPASLH
jgi:hypothetical protein